jgi:hypothetical protein
MNWFRGRVMVMRYRERIDKSKSIQLQTMRGCNGNGTNKQINPFNSVVAF